MTKLLTSAKWNFLRKAVCYSRNLPSTGTFHFPLLNLHSALPEFATSCGIYAELGQPQQDKSDWSLCCNYFSAIMSSLPFCAEYDKRGAAKCKKCKEKLEKGQLRIGKIGTNPFSESGGEMKMWHHLDCIFETFKRARKTTKKIEDPIDDIEGFAELEEDDKKRINALIDELQDAMKDKATPNKQTPKKQTPKKQTPQNKPKPVAAAAAKPKPGGTPKKSDDAAPSKGPPPPRNDPGMDRSHKDNSFREYRRICANVADEPSYLGKTDIISKFLKYGTNKTKFEGDLRLWVRLLLPGVIKRIYNLQSKQLIKLFSQIFNANQEEMLEDLEKGDVAETVRVFFEASIVLSPIKKSSLSIQEVDDLLEELSGLTKEEEQSYHLKKICKRCTSNDLKMIIRIIKGDLRINAGAKHILEGVHSDAYEAFQTTRNIDAVIDQILKVGITGGSLKLTAQVMTPVLPMLAEACKSVDYAFKKCPSGAMYSEIKYDGERVQVHKKGNQFKYYSRSLKEVMAHKVSHFKNFIPQAFPHGDDIILDSEVLMINNKTGIPLPFGTLGVHKKEEFQDANVCLFVFDCIHYNGVDLMDRPIAERREILEEHMTEIKNHVMFSEMKLINKKEDLRDMINRVLKQGLEGLVLKDVNSIYEPGKRHWLKVKKDYLNDGAMADSADLVVLGAWYGTGKKGGMMSVFLMGCFDPRINKWCTVTKVHTGHDDATLARLQNELDMIKISQDADRVPSWLKCTKAMVPDFVAADPKKSPIWEVTGAEFTRHKIHTADGISIRFPRVTKVRDDKAWEQATSLSYLQELYKKSRECADFEALAADDDDNDDGDDSNSGSGVSTPVKLHDRGSPSGSPSPASPYKKSPKPKAQRTLGGYLKGSPEKKQTLLKGKKFEDIKKDIKMETEESHSHKKAIKMETEESHSHKKAIKRESDESSSHNKAIKREPEESSSHNKAIKRESDESSSQSSRRLCKYGTACYNENPAHLMMFAHPDAPRIKHPTLNPLPDFLVGVQVGILDPVEKLDDLRRYVVAYGGEVLPEYRVSEATHVILNSTSASEKSLPSGATAVSADWLWDSIKLQKLLPTKPYDS